MTQQKTSGDGGTQAEPVPPKSVHSKLLPSNKKKLLLIIATCAALAFAIPGILISIFTGYLFE